MGSRNKYGNLEAESSRHGPISGMNLFHLSDTPPMTPTTSSMKRFAGYEAYDRNLPRWPTPAALSGGGNPPGWALPKRDPIIGPRSSVSQRPALQTLPVNQPIALPRLPFVSPMLCDEKARQQLPNCYPYNSIPNSVDPCQRVTIYQNSIAKTYLDSTLQSANLARGCDESSNRCSESTTSSYPSTLSSPYRSRPATSVNYSGDCTKKTSLDIGLGHQGLNNGHRFSSGDQVWLDQSAKRLTGDSWLTHFGSIEKPKLPDLQAHQTPPQQLPQSYLEPRVKNNGLLGPIASGHANLLQNQTPHDKANGQSVPVSSFARGQHSKMFHPMTVLSESPPIKPIKAQPAQYIYRGPSLQDGPGIAIQSAQGVETMFSPEYHGMHNLANASANVPNDYNCALWLTKLPADVTYRELVDMVVQAGRFGRLYCTYINYPDKLKHITAAAKVVFFNPEAAQSLLNYAWTNGLVMRGHRIMVTHNRIKARAVPMIGRSSRVLIITGHVDFVSPEALTAYFQEKFVFQVDDVKELIRAGDRAVVEYRFGSYRCQGQMAKMALERELPDGFEKAEFGDDPCEVGETYSSYAIAAERIQGKGM